MAISPTNAKRASVAIQRFGLGVKGSDAAILELVARNPLQALIDELNSPRLAEMQPEVVEKHSLLSHEDACFEATNTAEKVMVGGAQQSMKFAIIRTRNRERRARIDQHMHDKIRIGFVERLVIFWANHFSLFNAKSFLLQGTVGEFERSRIRPYVCGNFVDMMEAVYTHPAMIGYLDNENSIGANSEKGDSKDFFGMNENLAREILELHTVSTDLRNDPGNTTEIYAQADVIELAKILTGWTYYRLDQVKDDPKRGRFVYRPEWHEYGLRFLLDRQINNYLGPKGQDTAREAFRFLAGHRTTGRHIARKLILHFLMDEPRASDEAGKRRLESMVARLAAVFTGNIDAPDQLRRVAEALVRLKDDDGDDVLAPKFRKFRSSYEFLIALFRACGSRFDPVKSSDPRDKEDNFLLDWACEGLGQEIWGWQTPDGYPDESAAWLTPQGMAFRLDVAMRAAKEFGDAANRRINPKVLADKLYGPGLSRFTRSAIATSQLNDSKLVVGKDVPVVQKNGLTILFNSPEFLWR